MCGLSRRTKGREVSGKSGLEWLARGDEQGRSVVWTKTMVEKVP